MTDHLSDFGTLPVLSQRLIHDLVCGLYPSFSTSSLVPTPADLSTCSFGLASHCGLVASSGSLLYFSLLMDSVSFYQKGASECSIYGSISIPGVSSTSRLPLPS